MLTEAGRPEGDGEPMPPNALEAGLAAYGDADFELAARLLFPLAVDGIADAQRKIGDMYGQGQFFERNACTAMVWYDRSARNGDPRAMHYLAIAYTGGEAVRQDPILAYLWASAAESRGERGAWTMKKVALRMMTDAQETVRLAV